MNTHFIKGIIVLVVLVAGWILAVRFAARCAKGIRERTLVIRAGMAMLCGILAFSALDYFIVKSSGAVVGVVMLFTVLVLRRKQLRIRQEETNA